MQSMPIPIDALFESMTETGHTPSSAFAAICADCIVADMRDDRLMQTMPSAPASWRLRKVDSNAPTDGAAVSGTTVERAQPLPERRGRELDPVDELVGTESDRQRNDLDAELFAERGRQIARTVAHDTDCHS